MEITFNVLLITDTQEERARIHELLPQRFPFAASVTGDLGVNPFITDVVLQDRWDVDFGGQRFDLAIVATQRHDTARFLTSSGLLRENISQLLIITDHPGAFPVLGASSRGQRRSVLLRPFSREVLTAFVEGVILEQKRAGYATLDSKTVRTFLRRCLNERLDRLVPIRSPVNGPAFTYPDLRYHLGPLVDDIDVLENLTSQGLLRKQVHARLRRCPACWGLGLHYREVCPSCQSLDFVQETIIHHFACGHMNRISAFRQGPYGNELVCPKCGKLLRHIGLDYEKPADNLHCHACAHIFGDPLVQAVCDCCTWSGEPHRTEEALFHAYEISDEARRFVDEEETLVTGTVRLDSTGGLSSRPLFEHHLERELRRAQRYQVPCTLIMLHVTGTSQTGRHQDPRLLGHIDQTFQALSENLRSLDMACKWNSSTYAALLPSTPPEDAVIVVERMEMQARELPLFQGLDSPNLVINHAGATVQHQTIEDWMRDADPRQPGSRSFLRKAVEERSR